MSIGRKGPFFGRRSSSSFLPSFLPSLSFLPSFLPSSPSFPLPSSLFPLPSSLTETHTSTAQRSVARTVCLQSAHVRAQPFLKNSGCCGRVGRSVCPLAPHRPSLGRLVDVPSLRFFFSQGLLGRDGLGEWLRCFVGRDSVRVYYLGYVVGGTRVFFGTRVITISFCSSRSLLAFSLLARVFRECVRRLSRLSDFLITREGETSPPELRCSRSILAV